MDADSRAAADQSQRALRRRGTHQSYRPRPQLTSSNRGKANAELRRQRELDANSTFTEANELIGTIKGSTSSSKAGSSGAEEARAVSEDLASYARSGTSEGGGTDSILRSDAEVQRDEDGGQIYAGQDEASRREDSDCAMDGVLQDRATSSVESRQSASGRCPLSSPGVDTDMQVESGTVGQDEHGRHAAVYEEHLSPPLAKKARIEYDDDDEFDDAEDDDFYEQLVAGNTLDWEAAVTSNTASVAAPVSAGECAEVDEEDDYVARNRESYPATDGFRWSNNKEIKLGTKAVETAQKLLDKIKKETEAMEHPYNFERQSSPGRSAHGSQPTPPRATLTPISRSILNTRRGLAAREAQASSSQTSSLVSAFSTGKVLEDAAKSRQFEMTKPPSTPIQPPLTILNTPDRSTDRPTFIPAVQTPNRARGAVRLGTTARSTHMQSASARSNSSPSGSLISTPSRATVTFPRTPRISLGMTPRRTAPSSAQRFKTPFKDESRHGGAQSSSSTTSRSPELFKIPQASLSVFLPIGAQSRVGKAAKAGERQLRPVVFDLDKPALDRKGLRLMGFSPECTSAADVTEHLNAEDCDSIQQILSKPARAKQFAFDVEGRLCGVVTALAMLREAASGGAEVCKAWVENHYVLILWKLAAYTRHVLDDRYWCWEEVCRQLKYRYERELRLGHRSAIYHIQRQTLPATTPMVLCVYEVPDYSGDEGSSQSIVLTDGWHLIRAKLDQTLAGVLRPSDSSPSHKARIRLGTKIAIQGACLESASDGSEPMKAFDVSCLRIGGNAAKLARWDAKLGFAKRPFVATTRSLSAHGGVVPLMDVVITRLYPPAFSGDDPCPGYRGVPNMVVEWGQVEEEERQRAWDRHIEEQAWEIEQEHREERAPLERIICQLNEAYEGLTDHSYDDCE